MVGVHAAQVVALGLGGVRVLGGLAGHADQEGVEERLVHDGRACPLESRGERDGALVGGAGDRREPLRAVVHGVHGRDDRQQRLRGADVARGLLAADVLLAGLEGQAVGGSTVGVLRDAHEASGQHALETLAHRHVGGVRAAEEEGHAEALRGADGDVRALLAGRGDEREGQEVGGDRDERAPLLGRGDDGGVVPQGTRGAGLLQDDAVDVAVGQAGGEVGDLDLEPEGLGAAADDGDGLREGVGVDDGAALVLAGAAHEQHGLGDGGGLVEQRGVGDVEGGEVLHHGLEVQEGLEAALGDLGLVGRVRRVPGGRLEDVAADDRRGDRVEVALADHLHGGPVTAGDPAQLRQDLGLAEGRRQAECAIQADAGGHGQVHELLEARVPEDLEHLPGIGGAWADVAVGEGRGGAGSRVGCGGHGNSVRQMGARARVPGRVPPRSVWDLRVSAGLRACLHRR